MEKNFYKLINYHLFAKMSLITALILIVGFSVHLILGNNIYISLGMLLFGWGVLIFTWIFGIQVYKINLENKTIQFPRFSTDIYKIKDVIIDTEKTDIFLPKDDNPRLFNEDLHSRHVEYKEYKINVYTLTLHGDFGIKKFTFYDEDVRDKIYNILKSSINQLT